MNILPEGICEGDALAWEAFVNEFDSNDVEEFKDRFYGVYCTREEFAVSLVRECGYIPSDFPEWIERHIDWNGVAEELADDYSYEYLEDGKVAVFWNHV